MLTDWLKYSPILINFTLNCLILMNYFVFKMLSLVLTLETSTPKMKSKLDACQNSLSLTLFFRV